MQMSAGYHTISYEYRSGDDQGSVPSESYAELSWTVGRETFGNAAGTADDAGLLEVDVRWSGGDAGGAGRGRCTAGRRRPKTARTAARPS